MKELIRFSLGRRFHNKATMGFNIILFVAIGLLGFSDIILDAFNPSMFKKEVIYIEKLDKDESQFLMEMESNYTFKILENEKDGVVEKGYTIISKEDNTYLLHSKYTLSPLKISELQLLLQKYKQNTLLQNQENQILLAQYNEPIAIKNKVIQKNISVSQDKANIVFLFITSVYFMMLSFISGVASEVVNEKATKTLELILTSVSVKMHFFAKLVVGWLVIVVQGALSISYVVFWLLVRSTYDQGSGLLQLIRNLHLFEVKGNTFYSVLVNFEFSFSFIQTCFLILLFLLVGVFLLQLILVVVSSFVSSIEEAGNIQAPFYLLLLAIYYLVLAINNPQDLSEGVGYYLSFVPFLNMLLMPCRLLIQEVPFYELILSFSISCYCIKILLRKGIRIYEIGVLDYSCKGILYVFKTIVKNR